MVYEEEDLEIENLPQTLFHIFHCMWELTTGEEAG